MKILFLPHCLKKEYIQKLKEKGETMNYTVYVVPGSSMVKKILTQYTSIDKIVGVACEDELELTKGYTKNIKNKGAQIRKIKLLTDGCEDTEVNLEEVIGALK